MLTQKQLKKILYYNQDTGFFVYKKDIYNLNKYLIAKQGDIAGGINNRGYIQISVKNKLYSAHRLAWLYVYGNFPKQEIDHINHIRNDNRIKNLRDVSHKVNMNNACKNGENKLEENIEEYRSKKLIDKILNKLEEERIKREDKICLENEKLYKRQVKFYQYW